MIKKKEKLFRLDSESLDRVGIIDIGSNSVRLVVYEGTARSPRYFYNEKIPCGLGAGMKSGGCLNTNGKQRAINAILRFSAITKKMKLKSLVAVATAAVREARDGKEFAFLIEKDTGVRVQIIPGIREAYFSACGVLLGYPKAHGIVCDIGGTSLEVAKIETGKVSNCNSALLGPLALASQKTEVESYIASNVKGLRGAFSIEYPELFLVGGCWRAIARIHMNRTNYPLKILNGP